MRIKVVLVEGGEEEWFDLEDLERHTSLPQARLLLEEAVDRSIDEFASFFCEGLGNDPLTKAERATIKTYIAWQFGLGTKSERENAEEDSR